MTERYQDLTGNALIAGLISDLEPVTEDHLRLVNAAFGELPSDYLDFLREIGSGPIGEDDFTVYQGPASAADILGPNPPEALRDLIFVGDACGNPVALDRSAGWKVVHMAHATKNITLRSESFEAFIRSELDLISRFDR